MSDPRPDSAAESEEDVARFDEGMVLLRDGRLDEAVEKANVELTDYNAFFEYTSSDNNLLTRKQLSKPIHTKSK